MQRSLFSSYLSEEIDIEVDDDEEELEIILNMLETLNKCLFCLF